MRRVAVTLGLSVALLWLAPIATTTWRSDLRPGTAWGEGRWTVQGNLSFALGNSK